MKSKNSLIKTLEFIYNKLSIYFGEGKTKFLQVNVDQLSIRNKHINIKQNSPVAYLMCVLDKIMPVEPMVLQVINKINGKLKFLYRKKRCLTKELRRNLCSALIQPHFDYAFPAWCPNLNEKRKKKSQAMQNKCIRYFPKLEKMHHVPEKDFRLINWLSISKRVDQCMNTI